MEVSIFETHAHYDDEKFDDDREALLSSFPENNIRYVINSGASLEGCRATVDLCSRYDFMYGSLGIHPENADEWNDDSAGYIRKNAAENKKIVAIGEIGLDYYYDFVPLDIQKRVFMEQLDLSLCLNKPVVIHSRDAAKDTLDILKVYAKKGGRGTIHCFSYSKEMAREYVKMGFMIGVGGVVTFTNAKNLVNVVEDIPLEHIVLETDSPYLSPVPNRGKRNSALNIPLIAQKIAQIRGITYDEVLAVTCANAKKIYEIG